MHARTATNANKPAINIKQIKTTWTHSLFKNNSTKKQTVINRKQLTVHKSLKTLGYLAPNNYTGYGQQGVEQKAPISRFLSGLFYGAFRLLRLMLAVV